MCIPTVYVSMSMWKHGACLSVCLLLLVSLHKWCCVEINSFSSLMHTICTSLGMVGRYERVLVNIVHASYFNYWPFGLYCTEIN